jgi:hypothetical protein
LTEFPKLEKSGRRDNVVLVIEDLASHGSYESLFGRQKRLFTEFILPGERVDLQRSFRADEIGLKPGKTVSDSSQSCGRLVFLSHSKKL